MDKLQKCPSASGGPTFTAAQMATNPLPQPLAPETEAPFWAKWLGWLLGKPWRTALTLGFLDILSASGGAAIGFFLCYILLGKIGDANNYISPLISYNIFLIVMLYLKKSYGKIRERRPEEELRSLVIASFFAILLIFALDFIIYKRVGFSRSTITIAYLFSLIFIIIFRFGLRELLKKLWNFGLARENVLIVGDNLKDIQWLMEHLHIQRYMGFNYLGYVAQKQSEDIDNDIKYLGRFQKLSDIAKTKEVHKVFFAMRGYSALRHQTILSRLEECAKLKIPALIISQIFNDFHFSLTLDGYSGIFVIDRQEPAYAKPFFRLVKRSIDIVGSLAILLAVFPIWLTAIICIKLNDGGPIFFRHRLVGKDGNIFHALKFRTMVLNAQEILNNNPELFEVFSENYKLSNDPRVTRTGKWLRKSSMDELPQLINILRGEMSLVGPRPVKEDELERYGEFKKERIKIRPGLTGFWQVSGRCAITYDERIKMDKFYLYKCSIWLDLIILLKTPIKVISGHGAV